MTRVLLAALSTGLLQPGMPDLRQMSGIPLPVSSMPAGSLSVRLVRGDAREPIVSGEVVVEYSGGSKSATSGEDGRVRFDGLPTDKVLVARYGPVRSESLQLDRSGARVLLFVEADGSSPKPVARSPHPPAAGGGQAPPHPPPDSALAPPHPPAAGAPGEAPHPMDPASMAGIPLPSGDMPAGSLVVRIAFGGLRETLPDTEVQVVAATEGKVVRKRARTDERGRARVDGLSTEGRLVAAVIRDGVSHATPFFELPKDQGARMLLYVPKDGPPALPPPEVDRGLAAGTVIVRVETAGGEPVADQEVLLTRVGRDESTERAASKTGKTGGAEFEGQTHSPDVAYVATVQYEGGAYSSPPFQLSSNAGTRLKIRVQGTSSDASSLVIGGRSHIVVDPGEDDVEVLQVLEIVNSAAEAYDPGPEGLVIPLPEGQSSAALDDEMTAPVHIDSGRVVWKGLVEPGSHTVRFFFRTSVDGGVFHIAQPTVLPWTHVTVVVRDMPGIEIDGLGDGGAGEPRDLGGQKFRLFRGPAIVAGGTLEFTVRGLPQPDTAARNFAAALSIGILLWGVVASWRPRRRSA